MAATMAGYERREDEWKLQVRLARKEIDQFTHQSLALRIWLVMAERELDNLRKQIERAEEIDGFLRGKFTNQQLYAWQSTQLAALHHEAYRLALDLAMKAQAAAELELGMEPGEIAINRPVHSDTTYMRLTAGEELARDLNRLDAY
jgi:hypothetical protein